MSSNSKNNTRIGFHYFPDTLHYRFTDLNTWLPELKALGANWLTLHAHLDRAIPEEFIRRLILANIQPILHFQLSPDNPPNTGELSMLLRSYANWGVKYVTLFNRPNCKVEWTSGSWSQQELVERFLDIYLPLADEILKTNMTPIFPPLEPGGDYWDTIFLRSALKSIQRRGHSDLLNKLVIGAYGWAGNLPFNWGAGGPERWPGAEPYNTPPEEEDQRGFRIFEWYSAISKTILGKELPIIILAGGSKIGDQNNQLYTEVTPEDHAIRNLQIARLLTGATEAVPDGASLDPVPENMLACNFWLLSDSPRGSNYAQAWYKADDTSLPVVQEFKDFIKSTSSNNVHPANTTPIYPKSKSGTAKDLEKDINQDYPITHYLLLPTYDWGVADWHLDLTKNFIKKHQPTMGFSIEEAMKAQIVTIIGGEPSFSPELIERFRSAGCKVNHIEGDGTSIATLLETI